MHKYSKLFGVLKYIFLYLWLFAIVVFFLAAFYAPENYHLQEHNYWGAFFGTDLFAGVVFFVLLVIFSVLHKGNSKSSMSKTAKLKLFGIISLIAAIIFIFIGYVLAQNGLFDDEPTQQANERNNTQVSNLDNINIFKEVNSYRESQELERVNLDNETCQIAERIINHDWWSTEYNLSEYTDICPDCTSMAVALAQDYYTTDTLINSWKNDEVINNNLIGKYNYGCVKLSERKIALVYTNKNEKQSSVNSQIPVIKTNTPQPTQKPTIQPIQTSTTQNSNHVPVFISSGGYTVYCPEQNVSAVQSIDSTINSKKTSWANSYNDCVDLFYKTNECIVECKSVYNYEWDVCVAAYGYTGNNYDSCIQEVSDNYSACIAECPSSAEHCDWVYTEQRSLVSQINNLCK